MEAGQDHRLVQLGLKVAKGPPVNGVGLTTKAGGSSCSATNLKQCPATIRRTSRCCGDSTKATADTRAADCRRAIERGAQVTRQASSDLTVATCALANWRQARQGVGGGPEKWVAPRIPWGWRALHLSNRTEGSRSHPTLWRGSSAARQHVCEAGLRQRRRVADAGGGAGSEVRDGATGSIIAGVLTDRTAWRASTEPNRSRLA
jgi:hypothetical protein